MIQLLNLAGDHRRSIAELPTAVMFNGKRLPTEKQVSHTYMLKSKAYHCLTRARVARTRADARLPL